VEGDEEPSQPEADDESSSVTSSRIEETIEQEMSQIPPVYHPQEYQGLGYMEDMTHQADLETTRRIKNAESRGQTAPATSSRPGTANTTGGRTGRPGGGAMNRPGMAPLLDSPSPSPPKERGGQLSPMQFGPESDTVVSQEGEMARQRMFKLQQRKHAQNRAQFFSKHFTSTPTKGGSPSKTKDKGTVILSESMLANSLLASSAEEEDLKDDEWMEGVDSRHGCFKMPKLSETEIELMQRHVHGDTLSLGGQNIDYRTGHIILDCLEKNKEVETIIMKGGTPWLESLVVISTELRFESTIKVLDLSECNMSWMQLEAILPLIDRRGEGWEKKSAEELTTQLEDLNLRGNPLGDYGITLMARAFERNEHLTKVDISRCNFGEQGATALGRMLTENDNIKWMSIEWNYVGHNDGARLLSDGLRYNNALQYLDMSECGLRDNGASYVAQAIEENSRMKELDLSSNGLGEGASLVLSDSLMRNSTLERLSLRANPLGYEGACRLLEAVKENETLKKVDLSRCNFSSKINDVDFNENKPSGLYKLDLSKPVQRAVAVKLVELWHDQGPESWKMCRYNNEPFELTEQRHWPQRMPEKGHLEVQFVAITAKEQIIEAVTEESFQEMWVDIVTPSTTDEWRLSYVLLLAGTLYFTVSQIKRIVSKLQWAGDRIEAVTTLFGRITNPEDMKKLQESMRPIEWEQIIQRLGEFSNFSPKNPTGHHAFTLSRVLDYTVMCRLRSEYVDQWEDNLCDGVYKTCIRNMKVNEKKPPKGLEGLCSIKALMEWDIPREGMVTLDFVSFRTPAPDTRPLSDAVFKYMCSMLPHSLTLGMPTIVNSVNTAVDHEDACRRDNVPIIHTETSMKRHVPDLEAGEKLVKPDPGLGFAIQGLLQTLEDLEVEEDSKQIAILKPFMSKEQQAPSNVLSQQSMITVSEAELPEGSMINCGQQWPYSAVYIQQGMGKVLGKGMHIASGRPFVNQLVVQQGMVVNTANLVLANEGVPEVKTTLWAKTHLKLVLIPFPMFSYALSKNNATFNSLKAAAMNTWYPENHPNDVTSKEALKKQHLLSDMSVTVIRRVGIAHHFTCAQLIEILNNTGVFDEARDRVAVLSACYARLVDRSHLPKVLRVMTPEEQMMAGVQLGYANIIDLKDAEMQYKLYLARADDYHIAKCLAKQATRGGGEVNWNNLYINGEGPKKVLEDSKFWTFITGNNGLPLRTGEHPTNVLEFYFDIVEDQKVLWSVILLQSRWRAYKKTLDYMETKWRVLKMQMLTRNRMLVSWENTMNQAINAAKAKRRGTVYNVRKSRISSIQVKQMEESGQDLPENCKLREPGKGLRMKSMKEDLSKIKGEARKQKDLVTPQVGPLLKTKSLKSSKSLKKKKSSKNLDSDAVAESGGE